MFNTIKSHIYHCLFIGIFAATPFFIPEASAEVAPNKGEEIAGVGFGVQIGGGRYYDRPHRYRYYRNRNYYRHGYPYYREYYGPYNRGPYYDNRYYNRYPRGGGVYFQVR